MECFANFNQVGIYEMDEKELMGINGGSAFSEWAAFTLYTIGEGAKNVGKAAGRAARQAYEAVKDVVEDVFDAVSGFVDNLANSF